MTVTDIRPLTVPMPAEGPDAPPKSEQLAALRTMLVDPFWSDRVAEIRQAITYLTATSVLAA